MAKPKKNTGPQMMAALASLPGLANRPGLPAADSITSITPAEPSGPGAKFTVIHTNELDAYEEGALGPGVAGVLPAAPTGVTIHGSLFFDMSHVKGSRPGPPSLKSRMPVVGEVHPITKIIFK